MRFGLPRQLVMATMLVMAGPCAMRLRAQSPLTLADVVRAVTARHPSIAASAARIHSAEAGRRAAGAFGNPVASYQYDYTEAAGGRLERETMISAAVPLEFLYQRGPRVRQADAEVRAVMADAFAERQRLLLDATHAFYRVALAQVGASTAADLVSWLDSLVVYDQRRAAEGALAEADLLRTRMERDRAAVDLTMRDVELAQARAALSGFADARGAVVAVAALPIEAPALIDTIADPANRPDIRAATERVGAAASAITIEHRMLIRQLSLTLGVQHMGATSSLVGGVSLPVPLFDRNAAAARRASAERDAAAFDLAALRRTADADLAGARETARLLMARAVELTSSAGDGSDYLQRADDARRIALGAYREGAVPLLQVLDAARAWGEARITFFQAIYAQHESVVGLAAAIGADLSDVLPALAASHSVGVPK
jgi:outer membrane protein, heavy metal efflux system